MACAGFCAATATNLIEDRLPHADIGAVLERNRAIAQLVGVPAI